MHTVAVLALDGVVAFDLATPIEVFSRTRLDDGTPAYRLLVCGPADEVEAGPIAIKVRHGLDELVEADTVIVPGCADPGIPVPREALAALQEAAGNGARIASICAGAFTLAAAGLLDGLKATTHWLGTDQLSASHPEVTVEPGVLYVDNGQVLTSAGAAAGLDLCLHMIRNDYGSAIAAQAARLSVMPLEREGGQAQFIVADHPATPRGNAMEPLLQWMQDNAERDLTLEDIADQARMSPRTLNRRFKEQTGTTPLQWLLRARVRRAQHLLEATDTPVDVIAARVGFGSVTAFRERFRRVVGTSPSAYRGAFSVS